MFMELLLTTIVLTGARAYAFGPTLSDAAAAAAVHYSSYEPRPGNYTPNHTKPTASQLSTYRSQSNLSFLSSNGNALIKNVDGQFTGTTDEVLQWGAYKWGFDPNLVRAIAANESWWNQNLTGASYGILQIQLSSFRSTYPMSLQSTAFNADFKLAYQRACMDGDIPYLSQRIPQGGHHTYPSPNYTEQLWGCVGDWYSGSWYDWGAITYIGQVQKLLSERPWLWPPGSGF
jgi:hypothetical protein